MADHPGSVTSVTGGFRAAGSGLETQYSGLDGRNPAASLGMGDHPGRSDLRGFFGELVAGGPTIFQPAVQCPRPSQNADWAGLAGNSYRVVLRGGRLARL